MSPEARRQLVASALLGSERLGADLVLELPPRITALLDGLTGAHRLITLAAAVGQYERAGAGGTTAAGVAVPPCPAAPRCAPPGAAALFPALLAAGPDLVIEALRLLAAADRTVPVECLPELLDFARRHAGARKPLSAVQGPAGAWLAGLNPEWAFAEQDSADTPEPDPAADAPDQCWQTGDLEQRLRALRRVRHSDPPAGRALVQSTWQQDPPDDRAAFVAALAAGLSSADEAFLETALDDRRKPVRAAAASLLARLPESAYVQRMIARLTGALTVQRVKSGILHRALRCTLDVEPPEEPDPAMRRDGLEARLRADAVGNIHVDEQLFPKLGKRAALLWNLVAATPLDALARRLEIEVPELIAAARGSDWWPSFRGGWLERIATTPDARRARDLLTALAPDELHALAAGGALPAVLEHAPEDVAEAVVAAIAGSAGGALAALSATRGVLPEQVSLAVVAGLRRSALTENAYAVRQFALRVHPAAIPALRARLQQHAGSDALAPAITDCLTTLELRARLHQEFQDA